MYKKSTKKKFSPVQGIRTVVQIVSFVLFPGLFITIFSSIGEIYTAIISGSFSINEYAGKILLLSAVFVITFLWGRFFCGFICSFGAMQDLLWTVGKRNKRKPFVSQKADNILKNLKYAVLAFVIIGVWTFSVTGNTTWSPWTIFGMYASPFKGLPQKAVFLSIGGLLFLFIILGSVVIERFFCKYFCPLGALFSLVSRFRVFGLKRNDSTCSGFCSLCARKCTMSIPVNTYKTIRSGECINCMKCLNVCPGNNIKAEPFPAVSGTIAAMALTGITFAGTLPGSAKNDAIVTETPAPVISEMNAGRYQDGTYNGSAMGFRGMTNVTVTVSGGNITDITAQTDGDDREFFSKAKNGIIPAILAAQDTNVSAVSGATYSSRGLINAVADALDTELSLTDYAGPAIDMEVIQQDSVLPVESMIMDEEIHMDEAALDSYFEEKTEISPVSQTQGKYQDGTYTGTGTGLRGTTKVSVTVENGMITGITVISYQDDQQFFSRAESTMISRILNAQSTEVSTVSGATFSSNSIIEAVSNALGLEYTNPNTSMGNSMGGRGGRHKHW